MTTIVDLSAPIMNGPGDAEPLFQTRIDFAGHDRGAADIERLFGVPAELLRDGEGWAIETFQRFGTHNSTHVDAPWHYNSTIQGAKAPTIDELPLDWFFRPGVVLDMTHKDDSDAVTVPDLKRALAHVDHELGPMDIVLIRTDRDLDYERPDYVVRGPGVSPAATRWLYDHGVRVMGIDAWGWDAPLPTQAQNALADRRRGVFWAAHQVGLAYSQIERLFNLRALPPTGFTLACFPLRIIGASAAPARVVGIIPAAS
jgi:kynurenine formamidase